MQIIIVSRKKIQFICKQLFIGKLN